MANFKKIFKINAVTMVACIAIFSSFGARAADWSPWFALASHIDDLQRQVNYCGGYPYGCGWYGNEEQEAWDEIAALNDELNAMYEDLIYQELTGG